MLEIGKTYKNGNGRIQKVLGLTRFYPDWVWTTTGWYRKEDGRAFWKYEEGQPVPFPKPTWRDLRDIDEVSHG